MSMRINVARGLLRLGTFVQSLAIMVMNTDDLVEFSRQSYANPQDNEVWGDDRFVDRGLNEDENDLIAAVPKKTGALLLLGVGGGREAIPLARMGFRVTGVDYVPAMVSKAKENAARRGVSIDGLVQEISRLEVPASAYDVVWLSGFTFSSTPTRVRRIEMVRRIARTLKPGGLFLCNFHLRVGSRPGGKSNFMRRIFAISTLGNLAYEAGDILWNNNEFVHQFSSEDAIRSEFEEGGLSVVHLKTDQKYFRGSAVCRKGVETVGDAI
jgi:SAM-dependent methyltransferase